VIYVCPKKLFNSADFKNRQKNFNTQSCQIVARLIVFG